MRNSHGTNPVRIADSPQNQVLFLHTIVSLAICLDHKSLEPAGPLVLSPDLVQAAQLTVTARWLRAGVEPVVCGTTTGVLAVATGPSNRVASITTTPISLRTEIR